MSDRAAPLAGVTVLEVGAFMAAPFATMQLADLGARVFKIEVPAGGDPVRTTGPFVEAALRERDRTGEGQYIDVSLRESGVSFAIWEAGKYFATGEVGRPVGSAHQSTAPYQAVGSAEGFITVGAVTPKTWTASTPLSPTASPRAAASRATRSTT